MGRLHSTDRAVFDPGEKRTIFQQLTTLLHFSQFELTEIPRVSKQLWIYTQGLIHLALSFCFGAENERTQQRIKWFERMDTTPKKYRLEEVNHPLSVNIKSPAVVSEQSHQFVQQPMFYVGSTKVGVRRREYHRHTQVNRYKAIQVELAIRWWVSQDNHPTLSTIAVRHFGTYAAEWTYEHAIIEQLQAPLNHPLIAKHLTRNALKYYYKPDKGSFQGIHSRYRLFRRKKTFNIEGIQHYHSTTET